MIDNDKMNSNNWVVAQEGEKRFWEQVVKNKSYLDLHAEDFKKEIPLFIKQIENTDFRITNDTNILQIGCALFDIIDFLPIGNKYAIEPLEDYFSTLDDNHRDEKVKRVAGKAEILPYENASMDLIISHNMLDHVDSPKIVINEIVRVANTEGRIWIQVHTFSQISVFIKWLLLKSKIDTKHLYFWTTKEMLSLFNELGLEPIIFWTSPDSKSFYECIKAREWKPIVKKLLLIAPNRMTTVLKVKT